MRMQPFCVSGHEAQPLPTRDSSQSIATPWCRWPPSSSATSTLTSSSARAATQTPSAARNASTWSLVATTPGRAANGWKPATSRGARADGTGASRPVSERRSRRDTTAPAVLPSRRASSLAAATRSSSMSSVVRMRTSSDAAMRSHHCSGWMRYRSGPQYALGGAHAMGLPLRKPTLDDFLTWENEQPEKHEYFRGEVFAMVGGRRTHGTAIANLFRQLGNRLEGSPCRVFGESMKIQIADDTILYPDIFVTCDQADLATDMIFHSPTLVIEVLSPSTQAYDRSQKFALYRRLASLKEYILVDPDTRRVEAFRRDAEDQWVFHDMSDDESMAVPCLRLEVPLAQVFDGIEPPTA